MLWCLLLWVVGVLGTCPLIQKGVAYEKPAHYKEVNVSSIEDCCEACNTGRPVCHSWSFKASDVPKGIACRLLPSLPTSTRNESSFVSGTVAPRPPGDVLRLTVNGSQVLDENMAPIHLRGFTWELGHTTSQEGAFMKQLLPHATVMRLIALKWDNKPQFPNSDCMTQQPPYFKDSCFGPLDETIQAATSAGVWVVLTCRAQIAAGQNYIDDPMSDVFHNTTLRNMMFTMWKYVANHYKSFDRIAAYEIMSEPRDKAATATMVRDFYAEGCAAVQGIDPRAPCIVGSGSYYKLWLWSDDIIIPDNKNVIYTFDYFVPENYEFNKDPSMTYPGQYQCGKLYSPASRWAKSCCPGGNPNVTMTFDQQWSRDNIQKWAVPVGRKHNVPMYCNQWGIHKEIPVERGRIKYMGDLAAVFAEAGIHWCYWIWRFEGSTWTGFELVHQWRENNTVSVDHAALQAIAPYL